MKIAVGSTNPTKIDPVRHVFSHYFGEKVTVFGVAVKSGVSEQPRTDDEMFRGALNRARAAIKKLPSASYGVGIEGGVHQYSYGWFERSLVVIVNKKGEFGVGASGGLRLPKPVVDRIEKGLNLEQAVDELFGTHRIGEGIGMFGLFTKGLVTRTIGVEHGVAFALARFLHKELYDET
jgi:inosine/xanthosine triphosphatase